jgi:hypothetical protein
MKVAKVAATTLIDNRASASFISANSSNASALNSTEPTPDEFD